jgi:IclR family KDG regulon transcriptional repressor
MVADRRADNTIKSLVKALNIVKLFTPAKSEWGIKEIVEALGYHKSSVQRLVTTLAAEGFLERTRTKGSVFKLGPMLLMLGNVASQSTDLRRVARPFLRRLVEQTQETSHLCVVDQSKCYYLDKIDSKQAIRLSTYVGQRLHLHCSGVGKALLSGMSQEEVDRIIAERGLPRFTENTIIDREHLSRELASIREKGLSFDNEEYEVGLRCVAAPVLDNRGRVVAAISISGPTQRLTTEALDRFAVYVKEAARGVSRNLGYSEEPSSGARDPVSAVSRGK